MHGQEQCVDLTRLSDSELFARWESMLSQGERRTLDRGVPGYFYVGTKGRRAFIEDIRARDSVHLQNHEDRERSSSSSDLCSVSEPNRGARPPRPRGRGIPYSNTRATSRILASVLADEHSCRGISQRTGIPLGTTKRKLRRLVDDGVLFRRGRAKNTTYHLDERDGGRP